MKFYDGGVYLVNGAEVIPEERAAEVEGLAGRRADKEEARQGTIAWGILSSHDEAQGQEGRLRLRFDALSSHDGNYAGVILAAYALEMDHFPLPYVMASCHSTLCSGGSTAAADTHHFGASAAQQYGGVWIPPHAAVLHRFVYERQARSGTMILGTSLHTRYGAMGVMGFKGQEADLVDHLLGKPCELDRPAVAAVYLTGAPRPSVGPQDVALAILRSACAEDRMKGKVMEFVGPGVSSLSLEHRCSIDLMTAEAGSVSSVWRTDEAVRDWAAMHGRPQDYKKLNPGDVAWYDGCLYVDLADIHPMIALPFHPSNACEIGELYGELEDTLHAVELAAEEILEGRAPFTLRDKVEEGRLRVQQGIIVGCAGGSFANIAAASRCMRGRSCGGFPLAVYPASQPVCLDLMRKGLWTDLAAAGASVHTALCGPCVGGCDTPANGALSIRHAVSNRANLEGSRPERGQMAAVALMDARSIAATAANGGLLTSAEDMDVPWDDIPEYEYDEGAYDALGVE